MLGLMMVIVISGCSKRENQFGLINDELKKINKRLEMIEMRVEFGEIDLEKKELGPDQKALEKIRFPVKQDEKTVREYVSRVLSISKKQSTFSSDDPQIKMLARIGEKYFDILLSYTGSSPFAGNFHLNKAILKIASDKSKEKILNALSQNKDLIEVVLRNGWHWEIKDLLIKELYENSHYIPIGWIWAVSLFQDPETYEALNHYLIHGKNKYSTYEIIKDLPGINLDEVLMKAWEKTRDLNNDWDQVGLATVVLSMGRKDAIKTLLKSLKSDEFYYFYGKVVKLLYQHLDFRGSIQEMIDWYESNKNNLYFDKKDKRFKLK